MAKKGARCVRKYKSGPKAGKCKQYTGTTKKSRSRGTSSRKRGPGATVSLPVVFGPGYGSIVRIVVPKNMSASTLRGRRWGLSRDNTGKLTLLRQSDSGGYDMRGTVEMA